MNNWEPSRSQSAGLFYLAMAAKMSTASLDSVLRMALNSVGEVVERGFSTGRTVLELVASMSWSF